MESTRKIETWQKIFTTAAIVAIFAAMLVWLGTMLCQIDPAAYTFRWYTTVRLTQSLLFLVAYAAVSSLQPAETVMMSLSFVAKMASGEGGNFGSQNGMKLADFGYSAGAGVLALLLIAGALIMDVVYVILIFVNGVFVGVFMAMLVLTIAQGVLELVIAGLIVALWSTYAVVIDKANRMKRAEEIKSNIGEPLNGRIQMDEYTPYATFMGFPISALVNVDLSSFDSIKKRF